MMDMQLLVPGFIFGLSIVDQSENRTNTTSKMCPFNWTQTRKDPPALLILLVSDFVEICWQQTRI